MTLYKDLKHEDIYTAEAFKNCCSHKEDCAPIELNWWDIKNRYPICCTYKELMNLASGSINPPMILNNFITTLFQKYETELINGVDYEEDEDGEIIVTNEIYQYYIISSNMAEWLQEHTFEIIYYIDELDLYILGVTHWGTAWDYVTTEFYNK